LIARDPSINRDDISVVRHYLGPIGHEVLVYIVLIDQRQIGARGEGQEKILNSR
jgi:hypothetical protein